ncbi:MAG TPA: DNA sulfur modification protein DndB [Solirubrobacteraceae bacterium]|jgi:hypothetical protein|nr:DNA sulfur modification protein DndB [Solirubrobacteraceae bacterium]
MSEPSLHEVPGVRDSPLQRRGSGEYLGRLRLQDLLPIPNPHDQGAVVRISARELADAVDNNLIWTDQVVQRGIKPGQEGVADIEVSLLAGYPDPKQYLFYSEQADDIAQKLLDGERPRLNPLIWNLRPGSFDAYFDVEAATLTIYRGRIYLPDGHHRHQGIAKAFRIWAEAPSEYPDFDPDRLFMVELYFMSREDEGEFFYEKNYLGRDVARAKAFDLTSRDPYATLAKALIDHTPSLRGNVNRVTDQLSGTVPHVVTLSTLRSMMEQLLGDDPAFSPQEFDEIATKLARFWELLVEVRPELGHLDSKRRRDSRKQSMAAQAVLMYGYADLMVRFLRDVEREGLEATEQRWRERLKALSPTITYEVDSWKGDFFSRENPLWRELGVIQQTRSGKDAVSNVRQSRASASRELREHLGL